MFNVSIIRVGCRRSAHRAGVVQGGCTAPESIAGIVDLAVSLRRHRNASQIFHCSQK